MNESISTETILTFNRFILISLALLGLSVSSANASLFEISATGGPFGAWNPGSTDFTIIFDDTSGDSLFQLGELISFSGSSLTGPFSLVFDEILGVPDIPGISTQSGLVSGTLGENWLFSQPDPDVDQGVSPIFWTSYELQQIGAVPVPAAVWLFGTALVGLVGFGKRKSKVAA